MRCNLTCPIRKEGYIYCDVLISEEEQRIMDDYYQEHRGESTIALLIKDPPLIVKNNFKCPICKTEFTKYNGLFRED